MRRIDYMRRLRATVGRSATERGEPPRYSWDAACERGVSYSGWGLDELLRYLVYAAACERCEQCGLGDCRHEAARCVAIELGLSEVEAELAEADEASEGEP